MQSFVGGSFQERRKSSGVLLMAGRGLRCVNGPVVGGRWVESVGGEKLMNSKQDNFNKRRRGQKQITLIFLLSAIPLEITQSKTERINKIESLGCAEG
jgi:hypothetical protein